MAPKVEIETINFDDNDFVSGSRRWKVATLIRATKDQECEEFDLPLSGINLGVSPFNVSDIDDFLFQSNRVKNVDPSHPIILNWYGCVADGWHRIIKAILEGKETIRAIRLKKYVEPDFIEQENTDG